MEGQYTERWRQMILDALTPQSLEWLRRKCDKMGHLTPELLALIEKREREVNE